MTFPALQEANATGIIAHLSRPDAPHDDVRSLLRRCHDASTTQPSPAPAEAWKPHLPWILSLFAQNMRSALRARAAADGGAA